MSPAPPLEIFGMPQSRAFRVIWMAKELGLEFVNVPISFLTGETLRPDYLAINPTGRIPAIRDGGFTLFESLGINLYLARKHGGPLAPHTLEEEALTTQWSLWATFELERPLVPVGANSFLFPPEERDEAEKARGLARLERPLAALDRVLSARSHLAADRFTVADLNVASVLSILVLSEVDLGHLPYLDQWLAGALSRPDADYGSQRLSLPRPPNWADIVG